MFNILCVTNRLLCTESAKFLARIRKIAESKPSGIILREKDLPEEEYIELAKEVMRICRNNNVTCILHSHINAALELEAPALHLPLHILREMSDYDKKSFRLLGASCHSVKEAMEAESLGATYITAGHVFDTDCKKGLPGRGTDFLKEVCDSVSIPVFAIGGITSKNAASVHEAGACGVCLMSSLMKSENPAELIQNIKSTI